MAYGCLKALFYVMFYAFYIQGKNHMFLETLPFHCDDFIIVIREREGKEYSQRSKKAFQDHIFVLLVTF